MVWKLGRKQRKQAVVTTAESMVLPGIEPSNLTMQTFYQMSHQL